MGGLSVDNSCSQGMRPGVLEHSLAGAGLFHLLAHGVQVVGYGDDGEEESQQTDERNDGLQRAGATTEPEAESWREQEKPAQVEQEF